MKTVVMAILLAAFGCGCAAQAERTVYKRAKAAVAEAPDFPADADVDPDKTAEVHVAKSAAYASIPYSFNDDYGQQVNGSYTVWFRRVAVRWEVDTCRRQPTYEIEEPAPFFSESAPPLIPVAP